MGLWACAPGPEPQLPKQRFAGWTRPHAFSGRASAFTPDRSPKPAADAVIDGAYTFVAERRSINDLLMSFSIASSGMPSRLRGLPESLFRRRTDVGRIEELCDLRRTATPMENRDTWRHSAAFGEFRSRFLNGPGRSVNRKVQGSNPCSGASSSF